MEKNATSTKEENMLKKDFKKSNIEYFKSNKFALIALTVFLIVGITLFAIFGLNGNFEVKGCYEFSVTVGENRTKKFVNDQRTISKIIDSYDGSFDTVSIYGEGDETQYIVRYINNIKEDDIEEINILVAEKLNVEASDISSHIRIKPVVKVSDYLFAGAAILIILLCATIFAYVRYNGASALALIFATIIGTFGFISIGAMMRLSVGANYLSMLVILNTLILYSGITLFENMHKSSWMISGDYSQAMAEGIKTSKFRVLFLSIATMAIGVAFVLFGTSTLKYSSLNILFIAVVHAFVSMYVIPFVWNVFILHCRKREYKVKAKAENIAQIEEK